MKRAAPLMFLIIFCLSFFAFSLARYHEGFVNNLAADVQRVCDPWFSERFAWQEILVDLLCCRTQAATRDFEAARFGIDTSTAG